MQIGKILYPVTTLGPGTRVGIWTMGCKRFCKGCSNPELQTFDPECDVPPARIVQAIAKWRSDGVTVSGGEPFEQAEELAELVKLLRESGVRDILVYTGYLKSELESMRSKAVGYVLSHITALVDGPFVSELVDGVPLRGSSNQKIWIYDKAYEEAYREFVSGEKKVDVFHFDGETHFIGIPFEGYDKLYRDYVDLRAWRNSTIKN